MPYKDPEKQKAYRKAYYARTYKGKVAEEHRKAVRSRKRSTQDRINEYKDDKDCDFCMEDDNCCLEFHHIDPKEKDLEIGNVSNHGWGWDRIMVEIDKCVIVCANCHKKIHAGKLKVSPQPSKL